MKQYKGTKSEQNLWAAFAGESQARNRYTFFEEKARKEGNEEIAALFAKMAKNETAHAKVWYMLLDGVNDSAANLQNAVAGENQEWRSMYPQFAQEAREEGFPELGEMFEKIAEIERDHERLFMEAFVELVSKGKPAAGAAPSKPVKERTVYRCQFCGALFDERIDVCTVCGAIGSFEKGIVRE